ncbi:MAG: DegT/DnrJ/EryC1/StrS family aminotransferase [Peptococcaceae bacterium]
MINVTKTYLPPIEKYKEYIDKIYAAGWITNNGQYTKMLEKSLAGWLKVKYIVLVNNGTMALQIAYKLLEIKGEVITTPFSFVATTSSMVWEGLKPVFVDIDPKTLCINYSKIEEKISDKTSAIVPVHVFGNGCEVEEIDRIAKEYNLKVIYDAAHAFGINYREQSILNYGDISVLSFHATKLFHTIEGGALIFNDKKLYDKAKRMINFGITGPETLEELGINAKMNEFQAAMGLCVLDDLNYIIEKRKKIFEFYVESFKNNKLIKLQEYNKNCNYNYSYFPIIFENEQVLKRVKSKLEENEIYPRRYFYPSLDTLNYVESNFMQISNDISKKILCLPISDELKHETLSKITKIIMNNLDGR